MTATIIIPAHNEASVIARCLNAFRAEVPDDGRWQIIVAANGCTDETASIARETAPEALILELPQGSKTGAMNAANALAKHFPRIYLDADVQCSFATLAALSAALERPGIKAASPRIEVDLSCSNWIIKSYYRVWLTQPYVTRAMVGSGCFGLSYEGYEAIGDFPAITADDFWVYASFEESERLNVEMNDEGQPTFFVVSPPRTALDQIRVETRRRLGNAEVRRQFPGLPQRKSNSWRDLWNARASRVSVLDICVYAVMKTIVSVRAKLKKQNVGPIVWERDLAAREIQPK